jgi:lactate permease
LVASVATSQQGEEGNILRYVFWHSLVLAALVGVLVMLQAYVFSGGAPHGSERPFLALPANRHLD